MVPDAIYAHYLAAFSNRASGLIGDKGSTDNLEYEAARALGVRDGMVCCQDATKNMIKLKSEVIACIDKMLSESPVEAK